MSAGTRRSDLNRMRKGRKKPQPLWAVRARRYGFVALGLLGFVAVPYWIFSSGWIGQQTGQMERGWLQYTATAGLAVHDIFVTGRSETPGADVLLALKVEKGQPMLDFDPSTAKSVLETLPWVKEARVERRFPGTILVALTERQPVGYLQREGVQSLVDEDGTVLATGRSGRWANMPVLVGEGSPKAALALLRELADWPDLYGRVKALTFVNQRRWDLHLDNSVVVRLPENDPASALVRLNRAQQESQLLDKAVAAVDLRQTDRMVVEPTAEAAARRSAPDEGI